MENKTDKKLRAACETLESKFDTIYNETLFDASENHMDLDVNVMMNKDTKHTSFTVIFMHPGIFRSRPAFIAAVEAAGNACWEKAYHALYGDEAMPYVPEDIIVQQASVLQNQYRTLYRGVE